MFITYRKLNMLIHVGGVEFSSYDKTTYIGGVFGVIRVGRGIRGLSSIYDNERQLCHYIS